MDSMLGDPFGPKLPSCNSGGKTRGWASLSTISSMRRVGFSVGFFHVAVEIGVADDLDVVAQVVEYKDGLTEHEDRFGQALRVGWHGRHPWLEVADGIVGQVAHGPAMEAGQTLDRDVLVLPHLLLDRQQRVYLPCL